MDYLRMNLQTMLSARVIAAITIVSMIVSAFPVAFFVAQAAAQTVAVSLVATDPESVTFTNQGSVPVVLDGYTFGDDNNSTAYTIASLTLAPAASHKFCQDLSDAADCDSDALSGSGTWNNDGDTLYVGDGTSQVASQGFADAAADSPVTTTFTVDMPTAVENTDDGVFFDSLQAAIDAADAGETLVLREDVTVTKEVLVTKDDLIIDGNGHSINADITTDLGNNNGTQSNSVIDITVDGGSTATGVTIRNITLNANGSNIHGINLYNTTDITLSGVTINDAGKSGLVVNSSVVDVSDLTTSGSTWNAINVDQKTSAPAVLNIEGTSSHAESFPIPFIYVDDTTKAVTVNDTDLQYEQYDLAAAIAPAPLPPNYAAWRDAPEVVESCVMMAVDLDPQESTLTSYETTGTTAGALTIREVPGGYEVALRENANNNDLITAGGVITFSYADLSGAVITPGTGNEALEDGSGSTVLDTAAIVGSTVTFDLQVTSADDAFTITGIEEDCNPVAVETATVSLCKVDQYENPLADWRLALLGEQVETVDVQPDGDMYSSSVLAAGEYVLVGTGTYEYRGSSGLLVDALFSERAPSDSGYATYPYTPWRISPNNHLGIRVGGDLSAWGTVFSPSHVYYAPYTANGTDPIDFQITDTAYSDNVGTLNVAIHEGYAGMTDAKGCVTFTDVPYGNYEVAELLPPGWTNESGLGAVTVDEASETFTVMNNDGTTPEPEVAPEVCSLAGEIVTMTADAKKYDGTPVDSARRTPEALAEASDYRNFFGREGTAWAAGDFLSLGVEGSVTYKFTGQVAMDQSGADLAIWETTGGAASDPVQAQVRVEVSQNGSDFYDLGTFVGDAQVDIAPSGYAYVQYVRLTDDSRTIGNADGGDGYDVDAITIIDGSCADVPPLQCSIYSDTNTLVVENNDYAVETYVHRNWTDDIAGASWVWATEQVENPTEDETYTFVETFTLPEAVSATVTIAADNRYRLSVNGTEVADRTDYLVNFTNAAVKSYDITDQLVAGENTLTITVTNHGVSNGTYKRNPAGVLYRIDVAGTDACGVTTAPVPPATLAITSPATAGEVLSGTHTFTAEYADDDSEVDLIQWAIRPGVCETSSVNLAGNVGGLSDSYTLATTTFSADVDMSTWADGDYCFVVNPREQAGEENLRATQSFVLQNQPTPVPTSRIDGYKYNDANGNGVRDEGEAGVAGWTITVTNSAASTTHATTTDANGYYWFEVPAGTWTVAEDSREGWTQTAALQNGVAVTAGQEAAQCVFMVTDNSMYNSYTLQLSSEVYAQALAQVSEMEYRCDFLNQENQTTGGNGSSGTGNTSTVTSSGGGGRVTGSRTNRLATVAPTPQVLGVSTDGTNRCPFLLEYMQIGTTNNAWEVMKLQSFLQVVMGYDQPVTGVFGPITDANVKRFQEAYRDEILDPWYKQGIVPHNQPTGFVYKTTKWKINDIVCPDWADYPSFAGEDLTSNIDLSSDR